MKMLFKIVSLVLLLRYGFIVVLALLGMLGVGSVSVLIGGIIGGAVGLVAILLWLIKLIPTIFIADMALAGVSQNYEKCASSAKVVLIFNVISLIFNADRGATLITILMICIYILLAKLLQKT